MRSFSSQPPMHRGPSQLGVTLRIGAWLVVGNVVAVCLLYALMS